MKKISVIVPVFNTEKYIEKCLDSIISQKLEEIEIIVIDDGSTDGSGEICDSYCSQDSRVKVVHKLNEGLSCARNDGIRISTGQYILFVDSDDWIDPDLCSETYNIANQHNADIVLFSHKRVNDVDSRVRLVRTKLKSGQLNIEQAIYYSVCVTNGVWTGLYRRGLFDEVKFPQGKYFEDVATSHRLLFSASRVFLVNKYYYNHRVGRSGSITTNPKTKNHPDLQEMHIRKINDLISWGFKDYAVLYALLVMISYGTDDSGQNFFNDVINGTEIDYTKLSYKHRLLLLIYKVKPPLFHFLCEFTGRRAPC